MNKNKFFNELDNNEELNETAVDSWMFDEEKQEEIENVQQENEYISDTNAGSPEEVKEADFNDNPICGVSLDKTKQYDSYWDRNSLPLKIVLYGLLIFIVIGCIYYAIMWFMS